MLFTKRHCLTTLILILSLLLLMGEIWANPSDVTTIEEKFERYQLPECGKLRIEGQGVWIRNIHGRKPANHVIKSSCDSNNTQVLMSPGGGDHWDNFRPERKTLQKILASPCFAIDFKKKGKVAFAGGIVNSTIQAAFGIAANESISVNDGKRGYTGFSKLKKQWNEIRIVLQPTQATPGKAKLWVAFRPMGKANAKFTIVPGLDDIEVDFSNVPLEKWTGFALRLDGNSAIDDIAIRPYQNAKEALEGAIKGELKTSFDPILDHVIEPRKTLDLGGVWKYCIVKNPQDKELNPNSLKWASILVPESHRHMGRAAGKGQIWFRKKFTVPEDWQEKRVRIKFERVTAASECFVNGKQVGATDEGHFPFDFDITSAVKFGEENSLLVKVSTASAVNAVGHRPVGWSWFFRFFSGIQFPVHLESHANVWIEDVFVRPSFEDGSPRLKTTVTLRNDSSQTQHVQVGAKVRAEFSHQGKMVTVSAGGVATVELNDEWQKPRLWWPHDPHLYYLNVSVIQNGKAIDALRLRFGFRELKVQGHRLALNGRKFIHRRASCIPYYPYSNNEFGKAYLSRLRERGFNGIRLHGGISLRLVRMADEMGMLVSPESAVNEPRGHQVQDDFWPMAEKHLVAMVRLFRNNPSVIYWSVSNEFGSYYMQHKDPARVKFVDGWLNKMGNRILEIDPTRTVTYSGDGELGGWGKHGPAPTLSFHYAWQPFKLNNMIPNTAYWLDEGLRPWQGIRWDKTKPIMLSEDLYAPYAFKPPHGMTHWAGDLPYSQSGYHKAWFDAIRMLAEGYYHAGVSVWNPWGTGERNEKTQGIYKLGQPMPDFLIAVRQLNKDFSAGQSVSRKVYVYNELFVDKKCQLQQELIVDGKIIQTTKTDFDLKGGESWQQDFVLKMPQVEGRTDAIWQLRLTDKKTSQTLTERQYDYVIFPENTEIRIPPKTALLALPNINGKYLSNLQFPNGRHVKLSQALATNPKALIIAGMGLSKGQCATLGAAVEKGLRVLWIEAPPTSTLPAPMRTSPLHRAAYAFIRSPHDPVFEGFEESDFRFWLPKNLVTHHTFYKPSEGCFDVLLDSGGPDGLNYSPLIRLWYGKGYYLLCQLPLCSGQKKSPTAKAFLNKLIESMGNELSYPYKSAVLLASRKSELRKLLLEFQIPFKNPGRPDAASSVLIIDGAEKLDVSSLAILRKYIKAGSTIFIQSLIPPVASQIAKEIGAEISVRPEPAQQLIRIENQPLLDGISNADMYWVSKSLKGATISATSISSRDNKHFIALTQPAALACLSIGKSRVVISQVRWDIGRKKYKVNAGRFALTLFKNLGINTGLRGAIKREYSYVDLKNIANRGFQDNPEDKGLRGWFGNPKDDMRYFPVNRTGMDPVLNVPAPKEPFPSKLRMAGVPFALVDPQLNAGKSSLVLLPETNAQMSIPVMKKASQIWFVGALSNVCHSNRCVATVNLVFEDGTSQKVSLKAGVELNGYQYYTPQQSGVVGWTGRTPQRGDAVLYVFAVKNESPKKKIKELQVELVDKVGLGLVSITLEKTGF